MGLDNRFMGHFKNHPEVEISLAYFRKYFNLNDWMLQHCAPVQEDNLYDVIVTKGNLKDLLKEIEPIAEALNKFNYNQISYYEDNGYLGTYQEMFDRARMAVSDFVLGKTGVNEIIAGNQHTTDDVFERLDALEKILVENKGAQQ